MTTNIEGITQDTLRYLFMKARESLTPETEALKNDLTETFRQWIKEKIDARELIVIGVRERSRVRFPPRALS